MKRLLLALCISSSLFSMDQELERAVKQWKVRKIDQLLNKRSPLTKQENTHLNTLYKRGEPLVCTYDQAEDIWGLIIVGSGATLVGVPTILIGGAVLGGIYHSYPKYRKRIKYGLAAVGSAISVALGMYVGLVGYERYKDKWIIDVWKIIDKHTKKDLTSQS